MLKLSYKQIIGIILLILTALLSIYLICTIPFNFGEPGIMNVFIQSEATIIAIIISLSLIAVQLAVSAYSARVIKAFNSSLRFWGIVGLYLITIIFSLIIFLKLYPLDPEAPRPFLRELILIAYSLGVIALLALIPYIVVIFDLMQPKSIINQLKKEINEEKICSANRDEDGEDPMQPIVDIVTVSIEKNDSVTIKDGLKAIERQISKILNSNIDNEKKEIILDFTLLRLNRIEETARRNQNDDAKNEVARSMLQLGNVILGVDENRE